MNISKMLREWLVTNCDVKSDATDDECKEATAKAMVNGKLSADKYAELTKDPKDDEANEFSSKLDSIVDGLGKLTEAIVAKEEKAVEKKEEKKEEKKKAPEEKDIKMEKKEASKMIGKMGGTPAEPDEKDFDARVKEAAENYSTTTKAMLFPQMTSKGEQHPLAGEPVMEYGKAKSEMSELAKAQSGAWAKLMILASRKGSSIQAGFSALPQHDKELVCHLAETGEWDTSTDEKVSSRRGFPGGYKALIDDAVSGGIEAAPIVFDDDVIQTPLLHGELFPLVKKVNINRGRRIEGVSTLTVTGSWGGVDDTAITPFNTASYVSDFNTTIHRWEGAVQIGLDFISDTPIDFGQHITQQYGQRLLEELDGVIATGNGTTQPQGVMNSGATAVAWGGNTTIGNYESIRFGVAKPEHTAAGMKRTAVFCGTETSYERAMAIPVGAGDARRVFGKMNFGTENHDDYFLMNRPYKINENLTNQQVFYAILGRYRMYRRRGFTLRTSTEGDTLMRQNELLIVVTARYGGQMERADAASLTTTAPA